MPTPSATLRDMQLPVDNRKPQCNMVSCLALLDNNEKIRKGSQARRRPRKYVRIGVLVLTDLAVRSITRLDRSPCFEALLCVQFQLVRDAEQLNIIHFFLLSSSSSRNSLQHLAPLRLR